MEKQRCKEILEDIGQGQNVELSFKEFSWLIFYIERYHNKKELSLIVDISGELITVSIN